MTLMGEGGAMSYATALRFRVRQAQRRVFLPIVGVPGTLRRKMRIAHDRCRDVLTCSPPRSALP